MSDELRAALAMSGADDADLQGAVVTKYAAVIEWMAPDGERWLSLIDGDAGGERLFRWDVQGMFFNVLHDPAWCGPKGDEGGDE